MAERSGLGCELTKGTGGRVIAGFSSAVEGLAAGLFGRGVQWLDYYVNAWSLNNFLP